MTQTKKQRWSDIETGTSPAGVEQLTDTDTAEANSTPNDTDKRQTDDDSDGNDKFWKLFLQEAKTEAKYKVDIWKTELDGLLIFAGLFAGVLTAFLIDIRSRLKPAPQVPRLETPTAVIAAGGLWYASLVITLAAALWGVLAQKWLGEFLREINNNPDKQALERWRRDTAAKAWNMEAVITGVPLLTQLALGMFLIGFVFQSLDDDRAIGIEVGVLVGLGTLVYFAITFLPWIYSDCPYQTPITIFFNVFHPATSNDDTNTKKPDMNAKKIEILASRLNESSNDEIFSAAASMLDVKLNSAESRKWYKDIEEKAPKIAEALSMRLTSFIHQVRMIKEEPSSLTLGDTANSRETFLASLSSPIEYGSICLRVVFRSMEARISGDKSSPWITYDLGHIWKTEAFPVAWRLLSWSTDITRRLTNDNGTGSADIDVAIDWDNMIPQIFSNPTLRSIVGLSTCRGLLQGREKVKRVCALGLAMFVEVDAVTPATSPKRTLLEMGSDPAIPVAKDITERLWSELTNIWRDAMVKLLDQTRGESNEKESLIKLLGHKLYQKDIKGSVSGAIVKQLENASSITQQEAIEILTKLSEDDVFQEAMKDSGAIAKVLGKLESEDPNVRAAAFTALKEFGNHALYHHDAILSISEIVKRLDNESLTIQRNALKTLRELFSLMPSTQPTDSSASQSPLPLSNLLEMLWSTLQSEGIIRKIVDNLVNSDLEFRREADAALRTFSAHELYQPDIKLFIPTIITYLGNPSVHIRAQAAQTLTWLSELEVFQETLQSAGTISKLCAKLDGDTVQVQSAAFDALSAFAQHPLYQAEIKLCIPTIIEKLDDQRWTLRLQAVETLTMLSESKVFQQTSDMQKIIPLFVAKLEDIRVDVRKAVVAALKSSCANESYQPDIKSHIPNIVKQLSHETVAIQINAARILTTLSEHSYFKETIFDKAIPNLFGKLTDSPKEFVRSAAIRAISTLSKHDVYENDIKSLISTYITSVVEQLGDKSSIIQQKAVQLLTQFTADDNFRSIMSKKEIDLTVVNIFAENSNEDVRTAVVQALREFGAQEMLRNASKSAILNLIDKLSDPSASVCTVAHSALFALSKQESYQDVIRSAAAIPEIKLEDQDWSTQQQTIQILAKFSARPVFCETMKTWGIVTKFVAKLEDNDEDVISAVVQALSTLGRNGLFQELNNENVMPKLIAKLTSSSAIVRSSVCDALSSLGDREKEFLRPIVSTLNSIDNLSVRMEVYKILKELTVARDASNLGSFLYEIDMAICDLFWKMKDEDRTVIHRSITILAEATDQDLIRDDLKCAGENNESARSAVGFVVRSKLVYKKNLPDRKETLLALSRLANNGVFRECMQPAIPGLIDAIGEDDSSIWSIAAGAILALSKEENFRADLVPAISKFIQQLNEWDEEEERTAALVDTMCTLAEYKEFQPKLQHVVPQLMNRLSVRKDFQEKTKVAFYKAAFKFISKLYKTETGETLVPQLTRVIPNVGVFLIDDLLGLLENLINDGHLTVNECIALASSLRIGSTVSDADAFDVQLRKLKVAALLDTAHAHAKGPPPPSTKDTPPSSEEAPSPAAQDASLLSPEYSSFLDAILGKDNDAYKSKLNTLIASKAALSSASGASQGTVQAVPFPLHQNRSKLRPRIDFAPEFSA